MKIEPNEYLKRLSNGDTDTIKQLYKKKFPKVTNFIVKNNGTKTEAEDIFQQTILQMIARYKLDQFDLKDSFESYFFTACKNLWLRLLNKRKREVTKEVDIELVSEDYDMGMAIVEQEKWDLFQEKLNKLSENCQRILRLFFKKIPYPEITRQMEYSSENVLRQRIFKCKKNLSGLIKTDYVISD